MSFSSFLELCSIIYIYNHFIVQIRFELSDIKSLYWKKKKKRKKFDAAVKSQKEGRMVPESNESLEKLVLLIPKSRRITVTDIRAITGSITGPLIWRSLELGRGEGFITGWGGGWLRGGIEHPPRL